MEHSPLRESISRKSLQGIFELTIWCTVNSDSEDDARQVAFEYCQMLKRLFEKRLTVKAIEVGLPGF